MVWQKLSKMGWLGCMYKRGGGLYSINSKRENNPHISALAIHIRSFASIDARCGCSQTSRDPWWSGRRIGTAPCDRHRTFFQVDGNGHLDDPPKQWWWKQMLVSERSSMAGKSEKVERPL